MKKFCDGLRRVEGIALIVLLAGMCTSSFMQVLFRLVIKHPLNWTEELSRYLFVWLSFVGGALCVSESSHFKMDLLSLKLSQKGKAIIDIIVSICLFAFSVVLTIYGSKLMVMNKTQMSPALRLPMSIPYAALPVNGLLCCIHLIENISRDIAVINAN